jgi:hypothetical protein
MVLDSTLTAAIPILVGLIFVGWAVLERGYKTFLEARKVDPTIKFSGAYMLNLLISTGVSSVVIITIIPTLLNGLNSIPVGITVSTLILQAILGYETAYTILDKLNKSTESNVVVKTG